MLSGSLPPARRPFRYTLARAIAWILIAVSLLFALVFGAFGFYSVAPMLGTTGAFQFVYALGSATGALFVALVGFAFLAFFDIAERFIAERH